MKLATMELTTKNPEFAHSPADSPMAWKNPAPTLLPRNPKAKQKTNAAYVYSTATPGCAECLQVLQWYNPPFRERSSSMRRSVVAVLLLLIVAGPSFAKTHTDMYPIPCTTLWAAVKDTLRNSGKYGITSLENSEMTASYSMGMGSAGQKRINSVALNSKGDSCEMVVQSGFGGWGTNDAGDFKKRVDASLAKLKAAPPDAPPAAKPDDAKK